MDDDLPLLELFLALRRADFPLGITEYRDVLRALQLGFGSADRKELKFVCQALWVKTEDERRRFDMYFERILGAPENPAPKPAAQTSPKEGPPPAPEVPSTGSSVPPPNATQPPPQGTTGPVPSAAETKATNEAKTLDTEALRGEIMQSTGAAHSVTRIPRSFILTTDYYPVSSREMKQNWRYLRRMVREGPKVELDLDETVLKISREGVLLEPVLVPRRMNRIQLLLLVDRGGSMVPFHALGQELANTAQRGSRLGNTGIYYFHNVPVDYLYTDPAMVEGKKIDDLLAKLNRDRTVVLIFSDAGAARGGQSEERVELTQKFLMDIQGKVRRTAWLNPMPQARWQGTSAAEIAHRAPIQHVPMFEFTRRGMQNAIDVLRGRFAPMAESRL